MTPTQIKIFLLEHGLTVGGIARELGTRSDMVSQLFRRLRYYPTLAQRIERKYGIVVPRPARTKTTAKKQKAKRRAA